MTARDSLSGVPAGPIAPASATPTLWTDFGSDIAERSIYRVSTSRTTPPRFAEVRCSPAHWKASVLAVRTTTAVTALIEIDRMTSMEWTESIVVDRLSGENVEVSRGG